MEILNKLLWAVASALIIVSGIYFTIKLKFVQFDFKKILFYTFKNNEKTKGLNPLSTLMLTLAGKIGVGSIAGVALAIYIGGAGTIFWMWVIALLSASNTFAETFLGILYKEKDQDDIYKGGPSYYIKKGLKKKNLAIICSLIIILSYLFGFIPIQANTITKSVNEFFYINPIIIGIILSLISATIIFGGIKKISKASNKIVPVMTILYLIVSVIIIIKNIDKIPFILLEIVKSAFNLKPFFTGFMATLIIGIQRGIFANESGLGTGSIASSTTSNDNPIVASYVQMLGIYIATLLICTSTFFIIMTSNYKAINFSDVNGIEITQYAFNYHLGIFGNILIFISILLFAFSTILTGYYYIESNIKFFKGNINKKQLVFIKLITLIFLFIGCIISSEKLWNIVDILIAMLAIINIYSLLRLRVKVKKKL